MKYLLVLLIFFNFSYADLATNIINKNIKDFEEKKVFEEQNKNEIIEENKVFNVKLIEVHEDIKDEEDCIKIEKINILNMTIFNEDDFEDLIEPYLNKCNGLKNLSNLKDKISNRYIDKGYVTSRALLIPATPFALAPFTQKYLDSIQNYRYMKKENEQIKQEAISNAKDNR
ncbi:MAG: POTRA domain-containing protein [Arcobacteraceae bacterium]